MAGWRVKNADVLEMTKCEMFAVATKPVKITALAERGWVLIMWLVENGKFSFVAASSYKCSNHKDNMLFVRCISITVLR